MVSVSAKELLRKQDGNAKTRTLIAALDGAPPGLIVEIGCVREPYELPSDGWSTMYLARAADEQGRVMRSFDSNAENVALCNRLLNDYSFPPCVEVEDGEEALASLRTPIAFLYLDAGDDPSETLRQYRAAEGNLAPGAVVCVDDVAPKAPLLIAYFASIGQEYEIVPTEPGCEMLIAMVK